MKTCTFLSLFSLFLIINITHGLPDGMASCAWGRHKRSAMYEDTMLDNHVSKRSVSEDEVRFFLFNKDYPYAYQIYLNDESRLISGNFDSKKLTKFIIHGYGSRAKSNSCVMPRDAFLRSGDFNIIVVDWSRAQHWALNIMIPYPQVVKKLGSVADYVTRMLIFLESHGMDLSTTTVVGHSLGAHVAGIAGYNLQTKIHRIVGLDPAAPYFTSKGPGERLSKESATQVEVIHTEIDECGLNEQLGHYDFYPNSGRMQPGCDKYKCSHSRSYRFFAESLDTTTGFYARKCNDWLQMQEGNCNGEIALMGGLERTPISEGIYYVKTSDKPPYALGLQ